MTTVFSFVLVFYIVVFTRRVNALNYNITSDNITLYLYTWNNAEDPEEITVTDLSDLSQSNYFDPEKNNYFLFHGEDSNATICEITNLIEPLLSAVDINIFMVDYSGPAGISDIHDQCIVETGQIVAEFIKLMLEEYELDLDYFVLIGFSMGAHVAGETGKNLDDEIGTIIALDPYSMLPPNVYIDYSKGKYVQVIHTSILGIQTPLGHVDYYPNSVHQPGCGNNARCSHNRAVAYLEESISSGGFSAIKCESWDHYTNGLCSDNEVSYLGGVELDVNAGGSYYLDTNSTSPFSLG